MNWRSVVSAISVTLLAAGAQAEEFKPLDKLIDFAGLSSDYLSLTDRTTLANTQSYDRFVQIVASNDRGEALGSSLNQHRNQHIVHAVRFMQIPSDMTAGDVAHAWIDAGGHPTVIAPSKRTIYTTAYDDGHYVADSYFGTGFVCEKPGQPGVRYVEIWARRFMFVTADGSLVQIEPPKC